uniref:Putative ovule protein n=1 Tax=Solanum chacoense TaxID=4108 RepID=A0A0V0GM59_SOLCH
MGRVWYTSQLLTIFLLSYSTDNSEAIHLDIFSFRPPEHYIPATSFNSREFFVLPVTSAISSCTQEFVLSQR